MVDGKKMASTALAVSREVFDLLMAKTSEPAEGILALAMTLVFLFRTQVEEPSDGQETLDEFVTLLKSLMKNMVIEREANGEAVKVTEAGDTIPIEFSDVMTTTVRLHGRKEGDDSRAPRPFDDAAMGESVKLGGQLFDRLSKETAAPIEAVLALAVAFVSILKTQEISPDAPAMSREELERAQVENFVTVIENVRTKSKFYTIQGEDKPV